MNIQRCKFFYRQSGCWKGNGCPFWHPHCKFFNSYKGCKYGDRCIFRHEIFFTWNLEFSIDIPVLIVTSEDCWMDSGTFSRGTYTTKNGNLGTIQYYEKWFDLDSDQGSGVRTYIETIKSAEEYENLKIGWNNLSIFLHKYLLIKNILKINKDVLNLIATCYLRTYKPDIINNISDSYEEDMFDD
jgi:hypothetical protein